MVSAKPTVPARLPGVGPVLALTYRTIVHNPARFAKSRSVGTHIGLKPRIYQSGEVSRVGRISRSGDSNLRSPMYETALVLMARRGKCSSLKAWDIAIARRSSMQMAIVAAGRRLAVILWTAPNSDGAKSPPQLE